MIGGPVAGGILGVHWFGLTGWRWLFFLEGIPSVLLGVLTFFVLPDRPNEARWLSTGERDWLNACLEEERQAKAQVEHMTIWQALRHPAVLMLTAGLFFTYSGGYAFWFWEPTMLQRLTGWSVLRVSWFGPLIFGAALLGMLFLGWSSDRTGERRWHFAIPQLTAAIALTAWFFFPHSNALLVAVFTILGFGTVAYLPSFWALPSAFLTSSAAAAAVGFINCTASIGGFFGPKIFGDLSQRTGSFNAGFVVMIACWIVASILVLACPRERT
jgi:ACS family tartrate transporter-like MFS transporter